MRIVGLSHRRRRAFGTILGVLALAAVVVPSAQAGPQFKPAMLNVTGWKMADTTLSLSQIADPSAGDGIGPGSYLLIDQTDGNSYICTANFVWTGGGKTYLGAAGHCFLRDGDVSAPTSDPGFRVKAVSVCVADCAFGGQLGAALDGTFVALGPVVYARQSDGSGHDVGHDFGLVEIPAETVGVRANVPVWGGPTGSSSIRMGQPVCLYGNAGGLGEVFVTKARFGLGSSAHDGAWFANIPSFQGDSGSAVVNCPSLQGGTAVGILTHLATDGTGVVAGTTVAQAKAMVQSDLTLAINLVNG